MISELVCGFFKRLEQSFFFWVVIDFILHMDTCNDYNIVSLAILWLACKKILYLFRLRDLGRDLSFWSSKLCTIARFRLFLEIQFWWYPFSKKSIKTKRHPKEILLSVWSRKKNDPPPTVSLNFEVRKCSAPNHKMSAGFRWSWGRKSIYFSVFFLRNLTFFCLRATCFIMIACFIFWKIDYILLFFKFATTYWSYNNFILFVEAYKSVACLNFANNLLTTSGLNILRHTITISLSPRFLLLLSQRAITSKHLYLGKYIFQVCGLAPKCWDLFFEDL